MEKPKIITRDDLTHLIVDKAEVRSFLKKLRYKPEVSNQKRTITGADLAVPEVITGIILDEVERQSRLLPFVHLSHFKGRARQAIAVTISEAVWTELCEAENEITLDLREVKLDAYKVSGFFVICDSVKESVDPVLLEELIRSLGGAIAKAVDKAILYGTGLKMPYGICTRLAQTEKPNDWDDDRPAWEDLHTSNILTLDLDGETGEAFFAPLTDALVVAEPEFSENGLFWAMNRKTHRHILAKAGAYDFEAELNRMPILGGTIIDFDNSLIPDNQIIGGYGANYIMGERSWVHLAESQHYYFLQDQTVYKGIGYYDGMPAGGSSFVVVRFDNTAPTTSATFATPRPIGG